MTRRLLHHAPRPRTGWQPLTWVVLAVLGLNLAMAGLAALLVPRMVPWAAAHDGAPAPTPTATAKATPARAATTPADRVLREVMTLPPTQLMGSGWSAGDPVDRVVPPSFPGGCLTQNGGLETPVEGWHRRGTKGRATVLTQMWAYGAGGGAAAVEQLRQKAAGCASGIGDSPVSTGRGFTANASAGGLPVAWGVWHEGDVVVSAVAMGSSPAAQESLSEVATNMDTQLLQRLDGVCSRLDSEPEDARRNPVTAGDAYAQYARTVPLPNSPYIPVPEPEAAPEVSVTLPAATSHPDLAPVVLPPRDQWLDANGDGTPDTPPPLSSAQQGQAPSFVDPEKITIPTDLPTSEPAAPTRPQAPGAATVQVPTVDSTGPGCGWAFTGSAKPVVDEAKIKAAGPAAVRKGLVAQTERRARYELGLTIWQAAQTRWNVTHARYQAYSRYAQARSEAQSAKDAATQARQESIAAYTRAIADAKAALSTPTPASTPSSTPSSSTPSSSSTKSSTSSTKSSAPSPSTTTPKSKKKKKPVAPSPVSTQGVG